MDILHASNLAKSYKGRNVVRDVSLNVKRGEIIGLLGPNGAGKTTCFYMIVGLVAADSGNVAINDTDLTRSPMHERSRQGLAYLPQDSSIFRTLTVEDNIMATLATRKDLDARARRQKMEALLLCKRT